MIRVQSHTVLFLDAQLPEMHASTRVAPCESLPDANRHSA
jgi:hypothetical protein